MKSNIISKEKKDKIILSIGMIVKNEEKVLERCLKSLLPLMEKIPSELIIADTGSTDNSIEIAKKYTDKVFHFEWINDFAAARNSTLEMSNGKWYFFIDADEYLDEDIQELVSFFSNPNIYLKCQTGIIPLRNYYNDTEKNCMDVVLPRFHRICEKEDKGLRFIGTVHETIPMRLKKVQFSTLIHHTGYYYENERIKKDKHDRNEELMLAEYKKNPDNLRMLSHIIENQSTLSDAEEYLVKALELARKNPNDNYRNIIYMQATWLYMENDYRYALRLCQEYRKGIDYLNISTTIGILMVESITLMNMKKYSDALEKFNEYISMYNRYISDEFHSIDQAFGFVAGLSEKEFEKNYHYMLFCYYKLEEYRKVIELLTIKSNEKNDNEYFEENLKLMRSVCIEHECYSELADYLINTYVNKNNKRKMICDYFEDVYFHILNEQERINFLKRIENANINSEFSEFAKLILSQKEENFSDNAKYYISSKKQCYEEVIYVAIKNKLDFSDVVCDLEIADLGTILNKIILRHPNFGEVVCCYAIPEGFISNIKSLYFITNLYQIVVLNAENLSYEIKSELYINYVNLIGDLVFNLYNPELLNDDDVSVLPASHQFGYYMNCANSCLLSDDKLGYIRSIKKALKSFNSMKDLVEVFLNRFKNSL